MTAKEYFMRYQGIKTEIKSLVERREFYRDLASKCTPAYGAAPGGCGRPGGKMSNNADKAIDMERVLNERIGKLITLEKEIEGVIAAIPNKTARDLLTYRYINGWPLRTVAAEMGYTFDYMRHVHGAALDLARIPAKYITQ